MLDVRCLYLPQNHSPQQTGLVHLHAGKLGGGRSSHREFPGHAGHEVSRLHFDSAGAVVSSSSTRSLLNANKQQSTSAVKHAAGRPDTHPRPNQVARSEAHDQWFCCPTEAARRPSPGRCLDRVESPKTKLLSLPNLGREGAESCHSRLDLNCVQLCTPCSDTTRITRWLS